MMTSEDNLLIERHREEESANSVLVINKATDKIHSHSLLVPTPSLLPTLGLPFGPWETEDHQNYLKDIMS